MLQRVLMTLLACILLVDPAQVSHVGASNLPQIGSGAQVCTQEQFAGFDDPSALTGETSPGDDWVAQSFKPTTSMLLTRVSLYLRAESGAPGLLVRLHAAAGPGPGAPDGTPGAILALGIAHPTNSEPQFVDVTLPSVQLAPGVTYFLAISGVAPGPRYFWGLASGASAAYPDGQTYRSLQSGISWTGAPGTDLLFRVVGCPVSASTSSSPPTRVPTLAPQPDLAVTLLPGPATVPPGQLLSYVVTVRNRGAAAAPQTALVSVIPTGTRLSAPPPGCQEDSRARTLRCTVPPLNSGQETIVTVQLITSASTGSVTMRFTVDPENTIVEADELNNTAERSVMIGLGSPTATATPVRTLSSSSNPAIGISASPALSPLPPSLEGPLMGPPLPPVRQLWIQVLEATPAYAPGGELLWEAQPGEWYWVLSHEVDWALAVWELDPPDRPVWIQVDLRVTLAHY